MKNKILLIVSFSSLISFSCTSKKPQIKLLLDKTLNIKDTQTYTSFTIVNTGNNHLIIEDFTSSCNCTLLMLKKNTSIEPKDSLVVPVMLTRDTKMKTQKIVDITLKSNTKPRFTSFHILF